MLIEMETGEDMNLPEILPSGYLITQVMRFRNSYALAIAMEQDLEAGRATFIREYKDGKDPTEIELTPESVRRMYQFAHRFYLDLIKCDQAELANAAGKQVELKTAIETF